MSYYEGKVTEINTARWIFVIDDKVVVHMGLLAAHKRLQFLPDLEDYVHISNAHRHGGEAEKTVFLCERSRLTCDSITRHEDGWELLKLITDYKLGISDLEIIDRNFNVIKDRLKGFSNETANSIMCNIIKKLTHNSQTHTSTCQNKSLEPFTLKTISNCHYIDPQSVKMSNTYWYFGTHSKSEPSNILIGCLQVNKGFSIPFLYDSHHLRACLITNTKDDPSAKNYALNKMILIKEYRVFTEMYQGNNVPNYEYLMFDMKDVIVLDIPCKQVRMVLSDTLPSIKYAYNFTCRISKKAPLSVRGTTIELWLEVTDNLGRYFLGLHADQVALNPYLCVNHTYQVFHNQELLSCSYRELHRTTPCIPCKTFADKDILFVLVESKREHVMSLAQVWETILEANCLVSFDAVLKEKQFKTPLSSRSDVGIEVCGYGTPGYQTHVLVFTDDSGNSDDNNQIILYLNNWECLQVPLGLIPGMRVRVRNANGQKHSYLKSTAFTTLEVLNYEPIVFFDTANLCTTNTTAPIKYSHLSLGNKIPGNALIWSRSVKVYIRSLTMRPYGSNLNLTMMLVIDDEFGKAVSICKLPDALRLLLKLDMVGWIFWLEAMLVSGPYKFDTLNPEVENSDSFMQSVTTSLQLVNESEVNILDFKCRKLHKGNINTEYDGMPSWFCLEARTPKSC